MASFIRNASRGRLIGGETLVGYALQRFLARGAGHLTCGGDGSFLWREADLIVIALLFGNLVFMDIDAAALRRAIETRFDLECVELLCFDLNIDHENLRGGTKRKLIAELIMACYRYSQLDKLLALCARERPTVSWEFPLPSPTETLHALDPLPKSTSFRQPLVTKPGTWPYYSVETTSPNGVIRCTGVPLGYSGARIDFDVTNPNKLPIRISSVFVDVASFSPAVALSCEQGMLGGLVDPVIWDCALTKAPGRYACRLSTDGKAVTCQLVGKEMLTFWVTFDFPPAGLYELSVAIEYSIGSIKKVMRVEGSELTFGFFEVAEHEKVWWGLG